MRTGFLLSAGAGVGALAASATDQSVGVAFEGVLGYRFDERLSLRFGLDWGITHFERSGPFIIAGTAVAVWTAGAYGTVWNWLVTGDPAWFIFKFALSFVAFTMLTMGFVVSGILYALSPVVASSFFGPTFAVAAHLVQGDADFFLEGGFAAMAYADRARADIRAANGPLFGFGIRVQGFYVGAHAMWSPPALQSAGGRSAVYVAALTAGTSG